MVGQCYGLGATGLALLTLYLAEAAALRAAPMPAPAPLKQLDQLGLDQLDRPVIHLHQLHFGQLLPVQRWSALRQILGGANLLWSA